jgi:hypothetical protein
MVVGEAWTINEATVVAINSIPTWLDGPDDTFAAALMIAGPLLSAQMPTVALPWVSVSALMVGVCIWTGEGGQDEVGVATKFPRVAKN